MNTDDSQQSPRPQFRREATRTFRGVVRSPEMLGDLVRQARELRGLSQRQLGARMGIGQRWIWDLEQGKPGIFTTRLFAVLDELGIRLIVEIDAQPEARRDG